MAKIKFEPKISKPSVTDIANKMLITVGEARKLLGKDTEEMDDDELAGYILFLSDLANDLIKYRQE